MTSTPTHFPQPLVGVGPVEDGVTSTYGIEAGELYPPSSGLGPAAVVLVRKVFVGETLEPLPGEVEADAEAPDVEDSPLPDRNVDDDPESADEDGALPDVAREPENPGIVREAAG